MRIDAAVHVWSDDEGRYPWSPLGGQGIPDHSALVDELLADQRTVGFDGAVCIQPRVYGYDHRFLAGVLAAHPDRFAGVCLVDPLSPAARDDIGRLVAGGPFAGIRLLAFSEPDADWLAGPSGDAVWEEAATLGIPVSVLARPDQLGAVADRARRNAGTVVVVDHLGMVVPREDPTAVGELLACADLPNVWVKMSAFGFLSRSPWPYDDIHPMLNEVVSAFGTSRLLFGTDWPNTRVRGPYRESLDMFERAVDLDDRGRDAVMGENARRLWSLGRRSPGAGQDRSSR